LKIKKHTVKIIFLSSAVPAVLCCITLFFSSARFVSQEVAPKWFGLIAGTALAGIIFSFLRRKVYMPAKSLFLLISVSCLLVFFRDWAASGFNAHLLTQAVCLVLLFYVLQQATPVLPGGYLSGMFVLLATVLAFYGLLQHAGVLYGANSFKITGSFDNPAGYAAALACLFPHVFRFFRKSPRRAGYASAGIASIIFITAVLSGSRAAVAACAAVSICFLFSGYSGLKTGKAVKVMLVCAAVAGMTGLYFLKRDSADGRLLIWQSTWNMIKDKPLAGHGYGAFNAGYMLYQAEYFDVHPDSRYSALADNVMHPFNEYLLILSEHGIIGFGVTVLMLLFTVRIYRRSPDRTKFAAMLSLLSLAVFSCFSYPFKYPFSWIMLFMNIAIICPAAEISSRGRVCTAKILTFAFAAGLLYAGIILTKAETEWNTVAHRSLAGKTLQVLPEYGKLYPYLGRNGLFLYNHAAELHEVKEYEKSLRVFDLCTRYYNDMDVQMLLADNYRELGRHDEAEKHLRLASSMCPNRFMPLYQLVLLYKDTNRREEALKLAQQILDRDIKIPSSTVNAIRNEMRRLIEEPF
jgi:O-antigen ligase